MNFKTLAVFVAAAVVFLVLSGAALPEQVASHFGADGAANGFMPRNVVEANKALPAHLATGPLVAGMVAFVICTGVWAGAFIAHFYRRT